MMKGIVEIGNIVNTGNWGSPQRGRIYSPFGICPCLNCMQGGGLEPKILVFDESEDKDYRQDMEK